MVIPRLRRVIAHREYILYGASAEVYACLEKRGTLERLLPPQVTREQMLFRALASPSYAERILYGRECVKSIWKQWSAFGPFDLLQLLAEFEFDREFYKGYRDHSTHQLKVFLLGLYAYESCEKLNISLQTQLGSREHFELSWLMASLGHDLGYVFEVGDATQRNHAERVIAYLQKLASHPFGEFVNWHFGTVFVPAQVEEIENSLLVRRRSVNCFDDIRSASDGGDLMNSLENEMPAMHLCDGEKPLQTFLRYARSNRPGNGERPPFIDHGIASAYFLLYLVDYCTHWCTSTKLETVQGIDEGVRKQLHGIAQRLALEKKAAEEASLAMALHNIYPAIWHHDHAFRWENSRLTLHRFQIDIAQKPLCGLLRVVDALQEWDRPRFAAPKDTYDWPEDVQSQDLHILTLDGGLSLCFPADLLGGTGHEESRFVAITKDIKNLIHNLDAVLPVREIPPNLIQKAINSVDWGPSLWSPEPTEGGMTESSTLATAYDLYRQGRSLANNAAWAASAECHRLAADRFRAAKVFDWAARSLGRTAFNQLDLGNPNAALSLVRETVVLDAWQGAANYYWLLQHCARGAKGTEVIAELLSELLQTLHSLDGFEDMKGELLAESIVDRLQTYGSYMIIFFQQLVAREVSAGWPSWSLSDAGRMYILRAEVGDEASEVLFESGAKAYDDTELSSYAGWCRAKAALVRASRSYSLSDMAIALKAAQEHLRFVIQRPGGQGDISVIAGRLLALIRNSLEYYLSGEDVYLDAALFIANDKTRNTEEEDGLWEACHSLASLIREGATIIEDSSLLSSLRPLVTRLAFCERDRTRRVILQAFKAGQTASELKRN